MIWSIPSDVSVSLVRKVAERKKESLVPAGSGKGPALLAPSSGLPAK